jgi:hypothetical protein
VKVENFNLSLNTVVEQFPITQLYSRFLCGASALRAGRHISRIQFYMTYGEIDTSNPQSVLLVSDFKKYETAKAYLLSCKALTKSDLLNAHDILLRGSTHAGKFRTIQNWLGKRKESAVYVPPHH